MTQPITARSATDLLSLVPYLLGFHVQRGLVVLVCQGRQVEVTMRYDLEMFAQPELVQARFCHLVGRFENPRFFLAAFGHDREEGESALAILEQVLEPEEVIDSVHTDGVHWWSRLCDQDCCQRVACDPASAAAAAAVLAGSSAMESREELERSVEGPSLVRQAELLGVYARAQELVDTAGGEPQRCDRVLELLSAGLGQAHLGVEELCELGLLVGTIPPRDEAWGEMDRQTARAHVALWRQVVAVVPERWATPPLCLLAAAAWLEGNGALMACAIARAQQLEPDYSMLGLLSEVHEAAIHPRMWEQMWQAS